MYFLNHLVKYLKSHCVMCVLISGTMKDNLVVYKLLAWRLNIDIQAREQLGHNKMTTEAWETRSRAGITFIGRMIDCKAWGELGTPGSGGVAHKEEEKVN